VLVRCEAFAARVGLGEKCEVTRVTSLMLQIATADISSDSEPRFGIGPALRTLAFVGKVLEVMAVAASGVKMLRERRPQPLLLASSWLRPSPLLRWPRADSL
jgi:hypothetical protein